MRRSGTDSHAFTYNNDDLPTRDAAGSFTYDSNGNQLSSPSPPTLNYNPENQMSSITQSGTTTNYAYTGPGSTERTSAGSTIFASDDHGDVLASSTSGTATFYTYDGQGNLIGLRTGSNSYYYLYDNLGSVIAVITSTGTVSDRYSYTPYGTQTVTTSGISNPIAFQSGYQDPTGLIKYGARYYNPGDATWTQTDPTGRSAGYVFDSDDPINLEDPSGNGVVSDAAKGCVKGAGRTP